MSQSNLARNLIKVINITDNVDYKTAWNAQKCIAGALANDGKKSSNVIHSLILLQHQPVYTIGIRDQNYSIEDENRLRKLGADFVRSNRGGLITFHGPGQLTVYPILHLPLMKQTLRGYICALERSVIRTCRLMGVETHTSKDTGVWVNDTNKICAVGIQGRRVTTHGIGLNCNTDLRWFDHIVPCGIEGKGVTSLSKELKRNVNCQEAATHFLQCFSEIFQCEYLDSNVKHSSEVLKDIVKDS